MKTVGKDSLLAKAAAHGLLARGFTYPDQAIQAELTQGKYRSELAAALRSLGITGADEAVAQLERSLTAVSSQPDQLEGEYTYLFSRTVPSSPNETSYGRQQAFQRVRELSDIASFYAAFGFQVAPGRGEMPDHVGAELEFLAVLYLKEAYALENGLRQEAKICARARDKFLKEHLAQWIPAFAQRLGEQARMPYYPALVAIVHAVLSEEPAYIKASRST